MPVLWSCGKAVTPAFTKKTRPRPRATTTTPRDFRRRSALCLAQSKERSRPATPLPFWPGRSRNHFRFELAVRNAGADFRFRARGGDGLDHFARGVSRDAVAAAQGRFRADDPKDSFHALKTLPRILQ